LSYWKWWERKTIFKDLDGYKHLCGDFVWLKWLKMANILLKNRSNHACFRTSRYTNQMLALV
jgi:hypothetical protein